MIRNDDPNKWVKAKLESNVNPRNGRRSGRFRCFRDTQGFYPQMMHPPPPQQWMHYTNQQIQQQQTIFDKKRNSEEYNHLQPKK